MRASSPDFCCPCQNFGTTPIWSWRILRRTTSKKRSINFPKKSHDFLWILLIRPSSTYARRPLSSIIIIIGYALLLLITSAAIGQAFAEYKFAWNSPKASQQQCQNPGLRKEWRSLSAKAQQSYIKAFQCFSTLPSPYGSNGTLYDEYSRVHRSIGSFCRSTSPICQKPQLIDGHSKHTNRHPFFPGIGTSYMYMRKL